LARLEGWEQIKAADATPEKLKGKSLLVLGGPDTNALAKRWAEAGALVRESCDIRADGWTAAGEAVQPGADRPLLVTLPSPADPLGCPRPHPRRRPHLPRRRRVARRRPDPPRAAAPRRPRNAPRQRRPRKVRGRHRRVAGKPRALRPHRPQLRRKIPPRPDR